MALVPCTEKISFACESCAAERPRCRGEQRGGLHFWSWRQSEQMFTEQDPGLLMSSCRVRNLFMLQAHLSKVRQKWAETTFIWTRINWHLLRSTWHYLWPHKFNFLFLLSSAAGLIWVHDLCKLSIQHAAVLCTQCAPCGFCMAFLRMSPPSAWLF